MKTTYDEMTKGWVRFQEPGEPKDLPAATMVNILRWPWHLQQIQHTHGEAWYLRFETGGVDLMGWTEDDATSFIEKYG